MRTVPGSAPYRFGFHMFCVRSVAGQTVSGECQGEMLDYRRMLMEDYSLSPEIVLHCRGEIDTHCSGLHHKGRTLHCLMRVSRDKGIVEGHCQKAVSGNALWCTQLLVGPVDILISDTFIIRHGSICCK